jgi:inosine kinase
MKFPGRRTTKHYFPISQRDRSTLALGVNPVASNEKSIYVVGIDQLLVDIEIAVTDEFLEKNNFTKGQSFIIPDQLCDQIYAEFKSKGKISGEYPGGAIGNTLHNYSVLSDSRSVALGAIKKHIEVGDYAYKYLSKTSGLVDLSFLQPEDRPMGRALCFISDDSERTFAISKGCMNGLKPDYVPEYIVANASSLLISAYTLRSDQEPIFQATIKACEVAIKYGVPVILSLGTSELVASKVEYLRDFIKKYVTVLAMNQQEAFALTNIEDPLLACEAVLDLADLVLLTVGKNGLYLAAHCDASELRESEEPLVTKSIINYNQYEYSRAMYKKHCQNPVRIFTHIAPFKGGPLLIKNTNGAGDAALAALMHDITANDYHRTIIPNSPKHSGQFLTYSSISQVSKYANRASYEVLIQSSPRLLRGLPEKEDSLEDAYWRK